MNNEEIKQHILKDIAAAEEQGYTLIADDWGSRYEHCACPLGCVNLANGSFPEDQSNGSIQTALGVNDKWIDSFINGFDGNSHADDNGYPEAWKMGQEIRKETEAIPYADYEEEYEE